MDDIQRFTPAIEYRDGERSVLMVLAADGGWVRLEDHVAALAERDAEIRRLIDGQGWCEAPRSEGEAPDAD